MKANKIKETYKIEDFRGNIEIEIVYTVDEKINQINIQSKNVPDITMLLDEYKALKYVLEDVLGIEVDTDEQ